MLRRRQRAALRLEPLASGHRDPLEHRDPEPIDAATLRLTGDHFRALGLVGVVGAQVLAVVGPTPGLAGDVEPLAATR